MKIIKKISYTVLLVILISSCTSFRANMFMIKKPKEIKSILMYEEAVQQFNKYFIESKDLKKLTKVRQLFEDSIILDSSNIEALDYIDEIDSFINNQFNYNIDKALEYYEIVEKSDLENIDFLIYVIKATELKQKHPELNKLQKEAKRLKPVVTDILLNKISLNKEVIINENNHKSTLKYLSQMKSDISKLKIIDHKNKKLIVIQDELNNYLDQKITAEIVLTESKMSKIDYLGAELVIRKADQIYTTYYGYSNEQINNTKYQLFYNWSKSLTDDKKYTTALNILYLANEINPTDEVKKLIAEIKNKTKVKNTPIIKSSTKSEVKPYDFDQDIDDIITNINFYISNLDLAKAKSEIDLNLKRIKEKINITKLKSKIDEIGKIIKELYEESIILYNEEDYESAFENLKIVVSFNSDFEQAQAYYDKANSKLKALSGQF